MKNSNIDTLAKFLRDSKAKEKSESFDDMVNLLMVRREMREVLLSINESHSIISIEAQIPFPIEDKIAQKYPEWELTPEYRLHKGNVEALVFLKYSKSPPIFSIPVEDLKLYGSFFTRIPNTTALFIVWSVLELPSLKLDADMITKLLKEKELFEFENRIYPLKENIISFFEKEMKSWESPEHIEITEMTEIDLTSIFNLTLEKNFEKIILSKKPRLSFRKQALESLSKDDLEKLKDYFKDFFESETDIDLNKKIRQLSEKIK